MIMVILERFRIMGRRGATCADLFIFPMFKVFFINNVFVYSDNNNNNNKNKIPKLS